MGLDELIAAARESARKVATKKEITDLVNSVDKKCSKFEAQVKSKAEDDVFMARTYTL